MSRIFAGETHQFRQTGRSDLLQSNQTDADHRVSRMELRLERFRQYPLNHGRVGSIVHEQPPLNYSANDRYAHDSCVARSVTANVGCSHATSSEYPVSTETPFDFSRCTFWCGSPFFGAGQCAVERFEFYTLIMNLADFTPEQKQALLDLLILGMYADRNLASCEDACVQNLLGSFQFSSDSERDRFSDAAFTRTSRHTTSPDALRAYVNDLAGRFTTPDTRRTVYERLNNLLTSDGRVTTEESQLLIALRRAFAL